MLFFNTVKQGWKKVLAIRHKQGYLVYALLAIMLGIILVGMYFYIGLLSSLQTQNSAYPAVTVYPTVTVLPTPQVIGVDQLPKVDVEQLIHIHSPKDYEEKKKALINLIWGRDTLPSRLPNKIEKPSDIDPKYMAEMLTVEMDEGFIARPILFHTQEASNQILIIYHIGHGWTTPQDYSNIDRLLDLGYDVVLSYMPLFGTNSAEVIIDTHCCGPKLIKGPAHDGFVWLEHPLVYFFEPITAVINYANSKGYQKYYMTGYSGGGWTTVVYAAIDERIAGSFPVAGTLPIWVRVTEASGDFEQEYPPLLRIANYLDMYVMGSYGKGRYQTQVVNKYDPCCFGGTRYQAYEKYVQERVKQLGVGNFYVFLDDSHIEHKISDVAILKIIDTIRENGEN